MAAAKIKRTRRTRVRVDPAAITRTERNARKAAADQTPAGRPRSKTNRQNGCPTSGRCCQMWGMEHCLAAPRAYSAIFQSARELLRNYSEKTLLSRHLAFRDRHCAY